MDALLLAPVVFLAAAALDAAEARYVRAVTENRSHRAAAYSLAMYCVGLVGWLLVVRVSLWLLVPEALGLYAGTLWALSSPGQVRAPRIGNDPSPPIVVPPERSDGF